MEKDNHQLFFMEAPFLIQVFDAVGFPRSSATDAAIAFGRPNDTSFVNPLSLDMLFVS